MLGNVGKLAMSSTINLKNVLSMGIASQVEKKKI